MNMFDEARSLVVMMKMRNLSQGEVGKMLGVSQSYVANKLRLLRLDENIQTEIIQKGLSERHARALLRLNDKDQQMSAIEKICDRGLSVAETEALMDMLIMNEAPMTHSKSTTLTVIDKFLDQTKRSLNSLRASGAGVHSRVSYENSKIYISICIDENGVF